MAEFVVYEDSPLAEYLESINEVDTVKVKHPSLTLDVSKNKTFYKPWSIITLWQQSSFRDVLSISLSRQEESAFEEKFKYLIVTSPLLKEVLSVHQKYNKMPHLSELPFQPAQKSFLGVTTNLVGGLAIVLGFEKFVLKPKIPVVTIFLSTTSSLFFIYRHKCQTSMRQLYQSSLSNIQSFIDQSEILDAKVHRVLITIQEIELVSRGYRLSTPLSPISRIEQNSKNRKCLQLRHRLSIVLRRAFMAYEEAIIDMMDVVNKSSLYTLFDMYNVHLVASLSSLDPSDDNSLDLLKKLAQLMHLKRRECMVHFLALDVMTGANDAYYKWKTFKDVLNKIVDQTEQFTKEIVDALELEFQKPIQLFDKKLSTSKIEDNRLKKFVHQLSSIEQQLRTMEAKIYLCNEDVRQLNSESSTQEDKDKLLKEYTTVQHGIEALLLEWENGKHILESYLSPVPISETAPTIEPDEPINLEESEGKGIVLNAEDVADILNLPMASKASVFEAIAGVVEKNGKEKSKKTRQQRIDEMRVKRAEEAEKKLSHIDSQTMVHELKSVLNKRVNELDLNLEEESEKK